MTIKELKPLLTDEFLDTLVKAGRTCGWNEDHNATVAFIRWCFKIAGKQEPENLNSFEEEYYVPESW